MDLHPAVGAALERLGTEYEVLPCEEHLADTAAFCAAYGVEPADSANTILVAAKRPEGQVVACLALATTRLDVNRRVRELMGAKKASFASAEVTITASGMEIGGVTPFGLPDGLAVYVDAAVMERPLIVLGGGNRTSKLRLRPEALLALSSVRVVAGLATPTE